mgnify:CR=1 FL=1
MSGTKRLMKLFDYADGVAGHYCIGRRIGDSEFWEFWNPSGWAGSGKLLTSQQAAEFKLNELEHPACDGKNTEWVVEHSRDKWEKMFIEAYNHKDDLAFDGVLTDAMDYVDSLRREIQRYRYSLNRIAWPSQYNSRDVDPRKEAVACLRVDVIEIPMKLRALKASIELDGP